MRERSQGGGKKRESENGRKREGDDILKIKFFFSSQLRVSGVPQVKIQQVPLNKCRIRKSAHFEFDWKCSFITVYV